MISLFFNNEYYDTREEYVFAIAEAMRHEYEAVVNAGFVLQIDCPDLAMGRHIQYADLTVAEFRKKAQLHIEVLNHALANISPEKLRLHLCWGNYNGPHTQDIPLKEIIGPVLKSRATAISFEGANPRHEHEWKLWKTVKLPPGKAIIPGVLDSTTSFVEHPELVAERLVRYASAVGRENVIAGTDCGFGTFAGRPGIDPAVMWAKFRAMAEGARLASAKLWGKA